MCHPAAGSPQEGAHRSPQALDTRGPHRLWTVLLYHGQHVDVRGPACAKTKPKGLHGS